VSNPATIDSPCRQTTLALPWLLNGSLGSAERREVREHLIHCPACRTELARTRETLAVFTAAAPGVAEPKPAPAVAPSRFADGGRVLRRLSWAAMIAAVLFALGGTWMVGTRATQVAQQDRPLPPPIAKVPAPTHIADVATPAPIAGATAPRRSASVSTPRRRAAVAAPTRTADAAVSTPARPQLISMASFESGTVAPLGNGAVEVVPSDPTKIATVDFENGDLGEWQ
jgi:anti-sigma factor RsiW